MVITYLKTFFISFYLVFIFFLFNHIISRTALFVDPVYWFQSPIQSRSTFLHAFLNGFDAWLLITYFWRKSLQSGRILSFDLFPCKKSYVKCKGPYHQRAYLKFFLDTLGTIHKWCPNFLRALDPLSPCPKSYLIISLNSKKTPKFGRHLWTVPKRPVKIIEHQVLLIISNF